MNQSTYVSSSYEHIADVWSAASAQAFYFFQRSSWAEAFANLTVHDRLTWVAMDDRQPAADVFALKRVKVGGVPCRRASSPRLSSVPFIGGNHGSRDPRELLNSVVDWDFARLDRVRVRSRWLTTRSSCIHAEPNGGVTVLDLPQDGDWWSAAPKSLRKPIRRRRERAKSMGGLEVECAESPDDVCDAFRRFVLLESNGWKAGTQGTLSQQPEVRRMLSDFLQKEAQLGTIRVYSLRVGTNEAAFQVTVQVGTTLFMLKTTYDEEFAAISPGNLLIADIIERAANDPTISRLDFCTKGPWQRHWGTTLEPTYSVTVFNRSSVRGRILELGWRTLNGRDRASHHWPAPLTPHTKMP